MDSLLTAIGLIAAIMIVIVPLVAILLVSFASVHEEAARSLSGTAPNVAARMARRVLGFHGERASAPDSEPPPTSIRKPKHEVRFAHARLALPDPGKQPARRQPQPGTVRFDQRQPAGV